MKRQLIIVSALSLLLGISIGYLVSLGSSFKKSAESMAALPVAVTKMDDFSEMNIAVMLRMFKLSKTGKPSHSNEAVLWYLAKYYNQRSKLSPAEQAALTSNVNLENIEKIAESDEGLRNAIQAEKAGKAAPNTSAEPS